MLTVIVSLAFLFIVVLATIAFRLQRQVKKVERVRQEQEAKAKESQEKQRKEWNKSIQVLAQGLLEDQITKTEAAIRISVLLEYLGVSEVVKEEYSALYQLAEATAHIPILDQWKSLSTKEQLRFDKERTNLEEQYGDFVMDAAKRIMHVTF